VRLDAVIERFNRMKDIEIAISRDDITIKESWTTHILSLFSKEGQSRAAVIQGLGVG